MFFSPSWYVLVVRLVLLIRLAPFLCHIVYLFLLCLDFSAFPDFLEDSFPKLTLPSNLISTCFIRLVISNDRLHRRFGNSSTGSRFNVLLITLGVVLFLMTLPTSGSFVIRRRNFSLTDLFCGCGN